MYLELILRLSGSMESPLEIAPVDGLTNPPNNVSISYHLLAKCLDIMRKGMFCVKQGEV